MQSEKKPHKRRYGVALSCVLLGTLVGAWHNRQVDQGRSDIVDGTVRGVAAPPTNLLGKIARWVGDQTDWITHGRAEAVENERLRARVAALEGEVTRLREDHIDYDRLRGDVGFVRAAKTPLLAADIVARRADPKFDTLVISRGSGDGVKPNSVVVTPGGLVGRVFEVTPGTASVLMLTDQNSGVGARVQRAASRATGVCKGDNSPLLSLVYLPAGADIKPGDDIVTSGLGGVFPPGLRVGAVLTIAKDEGNLMKTARVRPAVDFDRLEEVFVIR